MDSPVDDDMRETLKGLADVLLPAEPPMPAASEARVHKEWLDRVLMARPDLAPALRSVLTNAIGRDPYSVIGELRSDDPAQFAALATVCAGAYYLSSDVRRLIGYPGQEPSMAEPGTAESDLGDSLIEEVIARGTIYRPTPTIASSQCNEAS
jgi:hypothetical protein